jgi:hypothetical protein
VRKKGEVEIKKIHKSKHRKLINTENDRREGEEKLHNQKINVKKLKKSNTDRKTGGRLRNKLSKRKHVEIKKTEWKRWKSK